MSRAGLTHYREPDARPGTVVACGRRSTGNLKISSTPREVTCISCQTTVRWKMGARGMTYEQAVKDRTCRTSDTH